MLTFKASLLITVAAVAAAALQPPRPPQPPPPVPPPPPVLPPQARLAAASAAAPAWNRETISRVTVVTCTRRACGAGLLTIVRVPLPWSGMISRRDVNTRHQPGM